MGLQQHSSDSPGFDSPVFNIFLLDLVFDYFTMSVSSEPTRKRVHPVIEFVLLIVPVVMSGFFLVYALTGLILEGRDKLNWSLEALDVAMWVGGGISLYSLCVIAFAFSKRLGRFNLLTISGVGHLLLALVLMAVVYIIVKL